MVFAYRDHDAIIELDPDQEIIFRLPFISEGPVTVNAKHAEVHFDPGIPNNPRSAPRWGTVTIHRAGMETIAIKAQDDGGGAVGGDLGPARDLQIELYHSSSLMGSDKNRIVAISQWTDDHWRLKIKRVQDPQGNSTERRQYKIKVTYNSLLPVRERRIPLRFFQNAFAENWNREQYVYFHIEGSRLRGEYRSDLAALYSSLPAIEYDFDDSLIFRNIYSKGIDLGVGVGPVAINPQGDKVNSFFVSVRVDLHGGDLDVVKFGIGLLSYSIPDCSIFIRIYIVGGSRYIVKSDFRDLYNKILSNTVASDIAIVTGILQNKVEGRVQEAAKRLELAQYKDGNPQGLNKFAYFFVPWLVGGDYELLSVKYSPGTGDVVNADGITEPATGDLVVSYVGPREPRLPEMRLPGDDTIEDGSVPLFLNPFESNIPYGAMKPGGFEPIPIHQRRNFAWLAKIEHIIVLMQENRSFDQVLGYLSRDGVRGYLRKNEITDMVDDKVMGLAPDGHQDRSDQYNEFAGIQFFPKKSNLEEPPRQSITGWAGSTDNPAHGIEDVSMQIDGGTMKGFLKNYARRIGLLPTATQPVGGNPELHNIMNYFGGEHLPIYAEIARQFGICDNWYSSLAGGTIPNRFLALTGRLNNDRFGNIEEKNPDSKTFIPSELPSLFDYLELYDKKWRVYEHGIGSSRLFGKYTYDTTNVLPFNDPLVGFEAAAKSGSLPEFTWIEPNYIELPPGNDDHAPADMIDGQILVERVVRAVVNSPKWFKTLLIITYDEHGGFYDHIPPPPNFPHIGGNTGTLGVRVPTFVISPLIRPGSVFHRQFDHTSIGATVLRRFCSNQRTPFLSSRMKSAYDLREVLHLADAPAPRTDFGIFGRPTVPHPHPFVPNIGPTSLSTSDQDNDFHWMLRITRLITGQSFGF